MHSNYSHFHEDKLGQQYDVKLLKRLIPFGRKYQWYFFATVFLVILITLLDISIPYVTKIAIDRYIVPNVGLSESSKKEGTDVRSGLYPVDLQDASAAAIVKKYSSLFTIQKNIAFIPYDKITDIQPEDIYRLRKGDFKGVMVLALGLILIVIAVFVLNFMQVMIMEYTGQMIMHDLRMKLFNHIQSLSMSYFTRNPVGRLVTRTTNDIQNMYEMFTSVITFVFKDLFLLVGIAIVLVSINRRLAMVTLSILPVLVFTAIKFAGVARDAFRELRIKIAEINSRVSETIEGIRVVQLFRQEVNNYLGLKKLNHEFYLAGMLQIKVFAVFMPLIELMGTVVVAVIVYYGGSGVIQGQISLGSLVAFIFYMRMFFRPVRDIAEKVNIMQDALASAERIFLILEKKESQPVPADSIPEPDGIQTLAFENVSFSYDAGQPVLKDLSFTIKKGEVLAVVGPTGAGKTSLINLIIRFYDPISGRILLNGKDIQSWPADVIRNRVALVTQDPFLFSGSIRENIVGTNTHIMDEELTRILEISNCLPFVRKFPEGADTILSERGSSISSGERQLISIARAIASDPELIILDEATSYVDSDTELRIQDAMEKLLAKQTTLVIAHRLSTARKADRIMVLKKGRIIEIGSHDELMAKKGFYFQLNQLQG
ncbi:MAG: ABC transporter ATP-binding protein [Desulfobacterium sp.]|nr:ABC transporter ATP-binding protein [Desulfobacterium sp.]